MPMRLKSDLYKKEQEDVREKIISILDLKNKNTYTLYELDKNEEIQNKKIVGIDSRATPSRQSFSRSVASDFTDTPEEVVEEGAAPLSTGRDIRQAVREDDTDELEWLLQEYGDVKGAGTKTLVINDRGKGHLQTAVWIAAKLGRYDCLKLLIQYGCDLNIPDKFKETPIYIAARYGLTDIMRLLLENSADVSLTESRGEEPTHVATFYNHIECVKLLLDHGANVNKLDKDGRTPIYVAAYHGNLEILQMLIERGGDVNKPRNSGRTPVYVAVAEGNLECLKYLVSKGGDVNIPEKAGRTPLNTATDESIKRYLRSQGAVWRLSDNTKGKDTSKDAVKGKDNIKRK